MGKWMPVEEVVNNKYIHIGKGGSYLEIPDTNYVLPPDLRLCRLVPDEGVPPKRVAQTIREALRRLRINVQQMDLSAGHLASEIADVDASYDWLDQQQKGGA